MSSPGVVALRVILGLSGAFGLLGSIIFVIRRKEKLDSQASRMVFYIVISDFVAYTTWLINNITGGAYCPLFGLLDLLGILTGCFWMLGIGYYSCMTMWMKEVPRERWFHVVCWGIPTALCVGMLAAGRMYLQPPPIVCWIEPGLPLLFLQTIPTFVCVVGNMVFMGIIILQIQKNKKMFSWSLVNDRSTKALMRLFLMQICFLIYSVGIILRFAAPSSVGLQVALCIQGSRGIINALTANLDSIAKVIGKLTGYCIPPEDEKPKTGSHEDKRSGSTNNSISIEM